MAPRKGASVRHFSRKFLTIRTEFENGRRPVVRRPPHVYSEVERPILGFASDGFVGLRPPRRPSDSHQAGVNAGAGSRSTPLLFLPGWR